MSMTPEQQAISDEREKVYGPPFECHENIGLTWTGYLQQLYGIKLPFVLPASAVADMMAHMKTIRSAKVHHPDNYIDRAVYTEFADQFKQREAGFATAKPSLHNDDCVNTGDK